MGQGASSESGLSDFSAHVLKQATPSHWIVHYTPPNISPPIFITKHDLLFYSPFKIFIYLAIMSLGCGMQALRSSLRLMACLVVAFELLVAERGI